MSSESYRRRMLDPAYREKARAAAARYRTTEKYRSTRASYKQRHPTRAFANRLSGFGLTIEDYETLLRNQGGVCALCRNTCATGRRLCVDHCHRTGKNRGLLCLACNTALGNLKDDVELFRDAVAYLLAGR